MQLHSVRAPFAAVLTVAVIALAGCTSSGTRPRSDAVAHLPSSATTISGDATNPGVGTNKPTSSTSSATPRPRSKLFETEQETEANLVPYNNCMRAHHVQVSPLGKPLVLSQRALTLASAAQKACADKQPLPPIEEDPANPKALDFNRAVAACLRSHGVAAVTIVNENGVINLSFGNGSVGLGLRYVDRCQHAVARRHH